MAYSLLVPPNTLILKLKLHCTRCGKKLKSLLSAVQGVQLVTIDPKQGTVTISGNVDPTTIVTFLGNIGRKAEVLSELRPSTHKDQNLKIIEQSKVVDHLQFNERDLIAQLQQLSGIKGLKNVEVTYSRTIRFTLEGHQNDSGDKKVEITIRDGVHNTQISYSGELCAASGSCCGEHDAVNRNLHGSCGCSQIQAEGYPHWATHGCGSVPPGPPLPWPGYASPLGPPVALGLVYDSLPTSHGTPSPPPPPPPPLMGYSVSSFLSDDNPASGCNII